MKRQRGAVLLIALVLLAILTMLAVHGMQTSALEIKMAANHQEGVRDFHDSESGLSEAIAAFSSNPVPQTGTGVADWEVEPWTAGTFVDIYLASSVDNTSTVRQFLEYIDIAIQIDGTISCYNGCDILLQGNVHVDGRDHDPPTDFDCNGVWCDASLAVAPEPDIPAIYQATPGTVDMNGSVTVDGAAPIIKTGGGIYTADQWTDLVTTLTEHASAHNGSAWGTRDARVIHHVDQEDMTINSNIDSAGILVITASEVTINGDFHHEGWIIMANPAGVTMNLGGGTNICGAIVAVGPGSTLNAGGSGTPQITYCSTALEDAAGNDALARKAWLEERG